MSTLGRRSMEAFAFAASFEQNPATGRHYTALEAFLAAWERSGAETAAAFQRTLTPFGREYDRIQRIRARTRAVHAARERLYFGEDHDV